MTFETAFAQAKPNPETGNREVLGLDPVSGEVLRAYRSPFQETWCELYTQEGSPLISGDPSSIHWLPVRHTDGVLVQKSTRDPLAVWALKRAAREPRSSALMSLAILPLLASGELAEAGRAALIPLLAGAVPLAVGLALGALVAWMLGPRSHWIWNRSSQ